MKKLAAVLVAALVLTLVAPVFAQPFADVPTDHWAYDAIAELAAKGLVEGYPDGSFKGDRALTRYEMAMVVARVLARIEAIVIPPPEVTKADVARLQATLQAKISTIQRLVNEFRAELAALGVRVTAIEEELNAIKARLDNTRITGDFIYLFDMRRWATPFGNSFAGEPTVSLARIRLTYTGAVARGVTVTLRARYYYYSGANGSACNWTAGPGTNCFSNLDFDRLYIDLNNGPFGLQYRIGRQVVALGPVSILMGMTVQNERRDGVRVQGRFGGVTVIGGYFWQSSRETALSVFGPGTTGYTAFGRVQFSLLPGWTFGLNLRSDRNPTNSIPPCVAPAPANWCTGFGWSVDFQGNLTSSIELVGEYASYTRDIAAFVGITQPGNAWKVQANVDLSRLSSTLQPSLSIWYRSWSGFYLPIGAATVSGLFGDGLWDMNGYWTPNNFSIFGIGGVASFGGSLSLNLLPNWSADIAYEQTRFQFCASCRFHEWLGGVNWSYARNTLIRFEYFSWSFASVFGNFNLDHYFRVLILARW